MNTPAHAIDRPDPAAASPLAEPARRRLHLVASTDASPARHRVAVHCRVGLKRTLDIAVSATLLALMLPVIVLIALAIVIEAPGPVFYRARRVGRHGRPMAMLKFRKMREDGTGRRLTLATDTRFTRIGAFLSRTKLDEIPQLWNVLRGDMSLVGPRPEDPQFVDQRRADYDEILTVRPGITGLSQIAFASESSILSPEDPIGHYVDRIFPQKCAMDRLYAAHLSIRTDLRILFWTTVAVLARRDVAVHRQTGRLGLRHRRVAPQLPPPPQQRELAMAGERASSQG